MDKYPFFMDISLKLFMILYPFISMHGVPMDSRSKDIQPSKFFEFQYRNF